MSKWEVFEKQIDNKPYWTERSEFLRLQMKLYRKKTDSIKNKQGTNEQYKQAYQEFMDLVDEDYKQWTTKKTEYI